MKPEELTIPLLMRLSHETAKEKGWWDVEDRSFGEQVALMHSELSEVLEEYRTMGGPERMRQIGYSQSSCGPKPEGAASEFADVLIRIADTCERYGIPLAEALTEKLAYNRLRPYRHGNKTI